MMMKPFLDLLYSLSHETQLELYPDDHGACKLLLSNQMSIQIEMDREEKGFYLVCVISPLPPGKFRESVLKHALYGNHFADSVNGILCFIEKLGALALTKKVSFGSCEGLKLVNLIAHMGEKAALWKQALDQNQPAPFTIKSAPTSPKKQG